MLWNCSMKFTNIEFKVMECEFPQLMIGSCTWFLSVVGRVLHVNSWHWLVVLCLLLIFYSYWLLSLTWSDANQSLFCMAVGFCGCKYIWPLVTTSEKSVISLTFLCIVTIVVTSCHSKRKCIMSLLVLSNKLSISHL